MVCLKIMNQSWPMPTRLNPTSNLARTTFIQNRKPGPVSQVRDDRLCHRSDLIMVSGVSKNKS